MSQSIIYHIKAIPDGTAQNQRIDEMIESVHLAFEKVLNYFSTIAVLDNSYIRLLFISEQNRTVNLYLWIYGVPEQFAEQIALEVKQKNYILEKVEANNQSIINQKMQQMILEETMAIVKSEKAIVSQFSALGYYYFTSVLEKGNSIPDNFSSILKTLEISPNSMVSFEIIPTRAGELEEYTFRDMKQSLEQMMQGYMYGGQMLQDPAAREAYPCYRHFADNAGRALFRYNILVASATHGASVLVSQLLSFLRFSTGENADFEILQIPEAGMFSNMEYFPLQLNEHLMSQYRNAMIWNSMARPEAMFRLPYLVTGKEAGLFFRLPVGDGNISAVKVSTVKAHSELLSEVVTDRENVQFGTMREDNSVAIGASLKAFTKHCLIVGMPGSGKTTFSVNLLLQFCDKGIPFLAIEPTKTEYRAMIDRVPELQVFTPGNNRVSPFVINPFVPPRGIAIEQYIPSLVTAFQAAFSMPSPLDVTFLKAIRTCYLQYGWKDYSQYGDEDVTVFGLHEFVVVFKQLIRQTNYSKEIKGNLESGGVLRLTTLLEQNRNIYDTVHSVPIEDLLSKPTVLELNAIDNAEQKALLMALLLINICLYSKNNNAGNGKLKNIILMDEAHVLLDDSGNSAQGVADSRGMTVKAMQNMIKEIRSSGTGIILADQTPSCVGRDIIANTDIKIAFRLVQAIEKELIADSTNMPAEDSQNLSRLHVGEAYVYYSMLDYPKLLITEDIRERENIRLKVEDKELLERMTYWNTRKDLLKPFSECTLCRKCNDGCNLSLRADAEYIAEMTVAQFKDVIRSEKDANKCVFYVQELMKSEFQRFDEETVQRLVPCVQIRINRKLELDAAYAVKKDLLEKWLREK